MNVGDKVRYFPSAVERRFLNKRRAEGEPELEVGAVLDATVVADMGGDVLDLYVPALRLMPLKQQGIPRGTGPSQWEMP